MTNKQKQLTMEDVYDLEVDGVDMRDAPDFVDAYFSKGYLVEGDRELTDEELDHLTDDYPEQVYEWVEKWLY